MPQGRLASRPPFLVTRFFLSFYQELMFYESDIFKISFCEPTEALQSKSGPLNQPVD